MQELINVMHREPTNSGVFLEEDYLTSLGLTHEEAAKLLGIDISTLEALLQKELLVYLRSLPCVWRES